MRGEKIMKIIIFICLCIIISGCSNIKSDNRKTIKFDITDKIYNKNLKNFTVEEFFYNEKNECYKKIVTKSKLTIDSDYKILNNEIISKITYLNIEKTDDKTDEDVYFIYDMSGNIVKELKLFQNPIEIEKTEYSYEYDEKNRLKRKIGILENILIDEKSEN